jgi:hypothetical protein
MKQGGVTVNNEKWTDPDKDLKDLPPGEYRIKVGKRRFLRLIIQE